MDSQFWVKFVGPYTVVLVLSDLNCEIATPDRKKKTQVCHVNLLEPFFSRDCQPTDVKSSALVSPVTDGMGQSLVGEVKVVDDAVIQPRLKNSETLKDLENFLSVLSSRVVTADTRVFVIVWGCSIKNSFIRAQRGCG